MPLGAALETSQGGRAPPKHHATFSALLACVLWGREGNPGHQTVLPALYNNNSRQVLGECYVPGAVLEGGFFCLFLFLVITLPAGNSP